MRIWRNVAHIQRFNLAMITRVRACHIASSSTKFSAQLISPLVRWPTSNTEKWIYSPDGEQKKKKNWEKLIFIEPSAETHTLISSSRCREWWCWHRNISISLRVFALVWVSARNFFSCGICRDTWIKCTHQNADEWVPFSASTHILTFHFFFLPSVWAQMRAYVLYNYFNEPNDRITFRISVILPKIKIILIFHFRRCCALHQLLFCEILCGDYMARHAECRDLFIRILLSHFVSHCVCVCRADCVRTTNKEVRHILYTRVYVFRFFFIFLFGRWVGIGQFNSLSSFPRLMVESRNSCWDSLLCHLSHLLFSFQPWYIYHVMLFTSAQLNFYFSLIPKPIAGRFYFWAVLNC